MRIPNFNLLVVGSSEWADGKLLEDTLAREVIHQLAGFFTDRVTIVCGDHRCGVDRMCLDWVKLAQKRWRGLSIEQRSEHPPEYPVGFNLCYAFPLDPKDWDIIKRVNLLGTEVRVIPEKIR